MGLEGERNMPGGTAEGGTHINITKNAESCWTNSGLVAVTKKAEHKQPEIIAGNS